MSRRVVCANCGGRGHVFKQCTHPIISCGIICRRPETGGFLMVQRKDSFAFVEFMRGKYNVSNRRYLLELFEGMTQDERSAVETMEFDALWKMLWNGFAKSKSRPEYEEASKKFERLRAGVRINGDARDTDIAWLIMATRGRDAPEWGFPKGRRAVSNESDVDCALREMHEETGIHRDQVQLMVREDTGEVARFEETFRGNNGVDYRHVYFLADLIDAEAVLRTCDREIKDARWTSPDTIVDLVADAPTRAALFKDVVSYLDAP